MLKIAVVIVNWNGEIFLERCLSALLSQTWAAHEIIVVDNASSDASLHVLRRFPDVRILAQTENLGFARANNVAISAAALETQWIALLNPDAFPDPRWLEMLARAVDEHPEVDIFGSQLVNAANPFLLDGAGDAYHVSGLVWRMGHGEPVASVPNRVQEVFSPCAAAAIYRRSALQAVKGFDEDFFCYVEDVDLAFRLRLRGHQCLYIPASVVHHVGSGTTGGRHSDFALYHGHRNLVWTYVKNMPGILLWLFLPLHLCLNVVTLLSFATRGKGSVIWRAKRDAVLGLPKMWRKRRHIQIDRVASVWQILRLLKVTTT